MMDFSRTPDDAYEVTDPLERDDRWYSGDVPGIAPLWRLQNQAFEEFVRNRELAKNDPEKI